MRYALLGCGMRLVICIIVYNRFFHAFPVSFDGDFPPEKMANQCKLQLSQLEMEQQNLLLIAVVHKFKQLKTY